MGSACDRKIPPLYLDPPSDCQLQYPLRPPHELGYRIRQEAVNLALLFSQPRLPVGTVPKPPLSRLPDPESIASQLRNTCFAVTVKELAGRILNHNFPILGFGILEGSSIRWRHDSRSGIETPCIYFRRIPYLDPAKSGDHKVIWELNRHQHLVLLAQHALLSNSPEAVHEITSQLESWFTANPFQRGINWNSALEVAFRALSWIFVYHLVGASFTPAFRKCFLDHLYQHALHLEANLSVYFSPNTHLLGEAVALHAVGSLFPDFPHSARWRSRGAEIVTTSIQKQVQADGTYFEQSSYYHVYALDMFLFHALLEPPTPEYRAKLTLMGEYLEYLLGPSRLLPFLGDDDGGRFFHPYSPHAQAGRATLAAAGVYLHELDWIASEGDPDQGDLHEQAAWWMDVSAHAPSSSPALSRPEILSGTDPKGAVHRFRPRASRLFPDAGVAFLESGDNQVIVDAGPFGPWSGGHSHADTLSVLARSGDTELLIDPGTYTYAGSLEERNRFRGTAAHNTVSIDGIDQAEAVSLFSWSSKPKVSILDWRTSPSEDLLDAICCYRNFRHRRAVLFRKPSLLLILDVLTSDIRDDNTVPTTQNAEHDFDQFWHLAHVPQQVEGAVYQIAPSAYLSLDPAADVQVQTGWRSPGYGSRQEAPVLRAHLRAALPVCLGAALHMEGQHRAISVTSTAGAHQLRYGSQLFEIQENNLDIRSCVE